LVTSPFEVLNTSTFDISKIVPFSDYQAVFDVSCKVGEDANTGMYATLV
jgi:hypothetical protein